MVKQGQGEWIKNLLPGNLITEALLSLVSVRRHRYPSRKVSPNEEKEKDGMEEERRGELLYAYREALSSFLMQKEWTTFLTITFRKEHRDAVYWLPRVWSTLQGAGAHRAFLASERFQSGVGIHVHGLALFRNKEYLAGGPPALERLSYIRNRGVWECCFQEYGRSRVENISNPAHVSRYCSKYIVKGGPDYYDFFGDWY